jgi:hypothetical protein
MNRSLRTLAGILLALAAFPGITFGAVTDWQKGMTMNPWGPNDFAEPWFLQSMDNLAATHADTVVLVIPYYQSSLTATDLQPGPHTPSDQALRTAIAHARELGLKVVLKPHATVFGSDAWRAWINPSDRNSWFANYQAMLVHYASLAEETGVSAIVLGTELINMADDTVHPANTQHWRDMIAAVRKVYHGKLTYSANWGSSGWNDEKNHIAFWDALDYIGISAYFPLTESATYNQTDILNKWDSWNSLHIKPLASKWGKDVVFTEIGYRSRTGALVRPPRWDAGGEPNEQEQADAYNGLFTFWNSQEFMKGIYGWDWQNDPNSGGPGDTGFTIQNKMAQNLVTNWFGNGNPPGQIVSFTASASVSPQNPSTGKPVDLTANLTNRGSLIAGAIVDVEIADSSGKKAYQQLFSGQALQSSETKSYSLSWTPDLPGTYTLKVGVFSGDWQKVYFWKEPMKIAVSGGAIAAPSDIVLYASDIDQASLHGTWSIASDFTAANGVVVRDKNNGEAKVLTAKQAPANYFDINFTADADQPYHLWLRMKADDDAYYNDSVHVQFSDSLNASGTADYRIGSPASLAVVLEEGSGGDKGWGWNDNDYGGLGAHIKFAAGGTHTIRIQQREDGVAIDQIVLSPERYLTARPGSIKDDATIILRPGASPTPTSTATSTPSSTAPTSTTSTATSTPTSTPVSAPTSTPTSTVPAAPTSTTPTSTPSTGPAILNIWWPEDGKWLGGVQPFKAMLEGRDPSTYSMIWQVDGGGPNAMYLSTEDYPHFEAWVDVSPWRWRGDNNYQVTFIAKDAQGAIITARTSTIHIIY